MNIGIDLRMFGTNHGGIGRYCKELFPRIFAMDEQNNYTIFCNKKELTDSELNMLVSFKNVKIVACNFKHYSLSEQTLFLRLLNKQNLDLVHFPNFNLPIFYNKAFVVTIHDMVHHKISGAKKSHLVHFFAYKKVIEHAAKNSKAIVTVSETSKRDIVEILNISPNKISVTYEGASLNTNVSEDEVENIKKTYLLNKPYFLFVGVLERKKNLVNLSRGFDLFLQKYKAKMDLVVVGKVDRHYPNIKHKMLDIKNNNNLVFTGYIEDNELSALYKGAHAFVSASLHEGFGLPGIEALSFGLPLLMSNTTVFNEIFDNSAIYFNPLDPKDICEKMFLLVRDPKFHEELQKRSFERSLNFDWNNSAQKTLELYKKILN